MLKKVLTVITLISVCFFACRCGSPKADTESKSEDNKPAVEREFQKFISLTETKGTNIPLEFNKVITEEDLPEQTQFSVLLGKQKLDNGNYVSAFRATLGGCTPTCCQLRIVLLEFSEEKIINRGVTPVDCFQTEDKFKTFIRHNVFFVTENKSQYYDSEPDPNAAPVEYPEETATICLAAFNGKVAPLEEFNKSELLLLRNLIFARHGHQFKLDSLREYFSKFDWYKPDSNNVTNRLTEEDKKLIDLLLKAESK